MGKAEDVIHVSATKHKGPYYKPPFLCFQEHLLPTLKNLIFCEPKSSPIALYSPQIQARRGRRHRSSSGRNSRRSRPTTSVSCEAACGAAAAGAEVHMDGEEHRSRAGSEHTGHGSVPLSPYFFWPRKDAWEELKATLESKPWISQKKMIILLNQATDIINLWQQSGGNLS
ncbi:hypothetical protein SASPL_156894 [Salvia splendens]|uniref:30S ribosomal protein 3 n=1 Tax=Salvia splendens TaxID=180675 RepID=A0A8X8VW15_SALSN|nr:hypothetical protein SASPL_156894 [Salvia splendens]